MPDVSEVPDTPAQVEYDELQLWCHTHAPGEVREMYSLVLSQWQAVSAEMERVHRRLAVVVDHLRWLDHVLMADELRGANVVVFREADHGCGGSCGDSGPRGADAAGQVLPDPAGRAVRRGWLRRVVRPGVRVAD